jgi:hypothetical protein
MHLGHTYGNAGERHPILLKPLRPAIFGHPDALRISVMKKEAR